MATTLRQRLILAWRQMLAGLRGVNYVVQLRGADIEIESLREWGNELNARIHSKPAEVTMFHGSITNARDYADEIRMHLSASVYEVPSALMKPKLDDKRHLHIASAISAEVLRWSKSDVGRIMEGQLERSSARLGIALVKAWMPPGFGTFIPAPGTEVNRNGVRQL